MKITIEDGKVTQDMEISEQATSSLQAFVSSRPDNAEVFDDVPGFLFSRIRALIHPIIERFPPLDLVTKIVAEEAAKADRIATLNSLIPIPSKGTTKP